jgi:hypothetical protein
MDQYDTLSNSMELGSSLEVIPPLEKLQALYGVCSVLPSSHEPDTAPYPEPDQSTPTYLPNIHFNIILPSMSRSS